MAQYKATESKLDKWVIASYLGIAETLYKKL